MDGIKDGVGSARPFRGVHHLHPGAGLHSLPIQTVVMDLPVLG